MADISTAMQAKSDQLNSVDIIGCEPVITVERVVVKQGDQPVSIFYHGCNNRPFKPSKGMLRIIAAAWGVESDSWIGKSMQIFCEPSVMYAGKEVGGIRIRAMSDIQKQGIKTTLTIARNKREPYTIKYLDMSRPAYPDDKFNSAFESMSNAMQAGKMTLEQVVAQCQKTGDLSPEQLKKLTDAAPVSIDEED